MGSLIYWNDRNEEEAPVLNSTNMAVKVDSNQGKQRRELMKAYRSMALNAGCSLELLGMEKAREFQKNICFSFIDYAKAFDCVDTISCGKIMKEMVITAHLNVEIRTLTLLQVGLGPSSE